MAVWLTFALLAGLLSYFGCKTALQIARGRGMIAMPGERQSHETATPTGGGLGLVVSILVSSLCVYVISPLPSFWLLNVLPGFVLLAVIGWIDDRNHVSTLLRLFVQLAVSLWLLGFGGSGVSLTDIGQFVVAVVAIVWMMNLYNFMDGSNGMAGFQGVFAGLTLAVLFQFSGESTMALLALIVAAACAGFLPLNFPAARVFMGDVASVPLGFIFASFVLYGIRSESLSLISALLIMSVFLVDATLTLVKRVFRGERWYTAHAQHIYQRLIAHGWSHSRVLMLYQAINVIWVLPLLVLAETYQAHAALTAGVSFLVLTVAWYILNRRLGT